MSVRRCADAFCPACHPTMYCSEKCQHVCQNLDNDEPLPPALRSLIQEARHRHAVRLRREASTIEQMSAEEYVALYEVPLVDTSRLEVLGFRGYTPTIRREGDEWFIRSEGDKHVRSDEAVRGAFK